MTTTTDTGRTLTQAELVTEATERFGADAKQWAFRCPRCGDVATAADFIGISADPNRIGQECIGRHLGALSGAPTRDGGKSRAVRGCDWTAYGLIGGPWTVVMPNGKRLGSFPLADAPVEAVSA